MTTMSAQSALVPTGSRALGLGFTGNLGNIDAYISAVNRLPMLSHDEEVSLAKRLRDNNDLGAAQELGSVLARLSAREASEYLIDAARRRAMGGGDNLSLIVIKLEPLAAPSR